MRHLLLFITILFFSFNSFAQKNNIVVFSERGEKFILILNGLRQNTDPATNVKVVDLDQPGYVVKVIFEDKSIPDVDKKIYFAESGKEVVMSIAMKKGVRKFKFISEAPIGGATANGGDQKLIVYNTVPVDTTVTTTTTTTTTTNNTIPDNTVTTNTNTANTNNTVNTNVSTNNNSTTTTNTSTNGTTGLSINVNENGMNVNVTGVDINVNGTGTNTTTTTTASNTSNNSSVANSDNSARYISNGTMCSSASMSQEQLIKLKYEIDQRTLVTKMKVAQEAIQKNCMLSSQVADIVKLFGYATDQLEIAKFSYQYTYDTKNYDLVVNALKHDYNRPKLVDFIGSSSGSENTNVTTNTNNNVNTNQNNNTTTTTTVVEQTVTTTSPAPAYVAPATSGCAYPMSDAEFKTAKQSISSKSFEDSKLTVAKQIMKNKCLNTAQVKEIMGLFSFEGTKLDFSKAAYEYVYDRQNYYELNDAFTFESSIDDLNEYVESKK